MQHRERQNQNSLSNIR